MAEDENLSFEDAFAEMAKDPEAMAEVLWIAESSIADGLEEWPWDPTTPNA
jgi:hypothetical protein